MYHVLHEIVCHRIIFDDQGHTPLFAFMKAHGIRVKVKDYDIGNIVKPDFSMTLEKREILQTYEKDFLECFDIITTDRKKNIGQRCTTIRNQMFVQMGWTKVLALLNCDKEIHEFLAGRNISGVIS